MKISNIPFCTTDWSSIPPTEHPGDSGKALWRTLQLGDIRVRLVEYTPGYVADHWCARGHILLVLEGTLLTELQDGRRFELGPMMSYQVADDDGKHRSSTQTGARLFIVD
ncbi:DHCW motif cupin fold protein [Myxococcus stipitatus]|uniref:DHCW motif cupin fold protein n=1 Tax=Myxococcus stipitatus TaxID=83455 RepID=UPI0030CB13D8